jgi:hypothetical protein
VLDATAELIVVCVLEPDVEVCVPLEELEEDEVDLPDIVPKPDINKLAGVREE